VQPKLSATEPEYVEKITLGSIIKSIDLSSLGAKRAPFLIHTCSKFETDLFDESNVNIILCFDLV
jgi:hypothetical protein